MELAYCLLSTDWKKNLAIEDLVIRGGVEDTTFEAKAMDFEKVRGQGQGPSCRGQVASRPKTERLEAKAKAKDTFENTRKYKC